jgi:hypothetical protein
MKETAMRPMWDANAPEEKPVPIALLGCEDKRQWQLVQCSEARRLWADKARIRREWQGKGLYSIWMLCDDRKNPVCEIQLMFNLLTREWREVTARNFRDGKWNPPVAGLENPDWQPVNNDSSEYYAVAVRNALDVLTFTLSQD